MISYFFKVFQFFAALCFNRHLLTFWILACLHTARNAPWKWMHLIFFVPTSCVSGADRKLIHLLQKTLFVCVYANSSLPVHQPSSFVTRSTRVIDSSRPSLLSTHVIGQSLLFCPWRYSHLDLICETPADFENTQLKWSYPLSFNADSDSTHSKYLDAQSCTSANRDARERARLA